MDLYSDVGHQSPGDPIALPTHSGVSLSFSGTAYSLLGYRTKYLYDELNRLTQEAFEDHDAGKDTKEYYYDDGGRLTRLTDQELNDHDMLYDDVNRLTKKDIDTSTSGMGGTTLQVFYYDPLGRMTRATDDNGSNDTSTADWAYDDAGRVTLETQQVGSKTARDITSYFDPAGRRTRLAYPQSRNIDYLYDDANNLTEIKEGSTVYAAYEYDGINLATKKGLNITGDPPAAMISLNVSYDGAYRNTRYDWVDATPTTVVGFSYGYDAAGNKNYQEHLHDTDMSQYYIYDSVYRLTAFDEGTLNVGKTGITSPTFYQDWLLDGVGNWTKFYDNSATAETWDHSPTNEITKIDSDDLQWDENGNLTRDNGSRSTTDYQYKYDALNRLIEVYDQDSSITVGRYFYDALNRRVFREADEDGDGVSDECLINFYDGWRVVEERPYDADSGLTRGYVYGNYIDEPIFVGYDSDGNGVTDENHYYTHNNLYSVEAMLDDAGDIIERYEYTPYGEVTVYVDDGGDGDWTDGDETTGSLSGNYYTFTGRRSDPESELMYFRNRYYSPELGRFVTRDPAESPEAQSLYLYARSAPTRWLDPLGLWTLTSPPTPAEALKCLKKLTIDKIVASLVKKLTRKTICDQVTTDCVPNRTKQGKFSKSNTVTAESDFEILKGFYECLLGILVPDIPGIAEEVIEEEVPTPDFDIPTLPEVPSVSGITSFAGHVEVEWWCAGKDKVKYQIWGYVEGGGAKSGAEFLDEGTCPRKTGNRCECVCDIYGD